MIREETDKNGDGNPEEATAWHYDENGNMIRQENDYDGDGNPETVIIKTYKQTAAWFELYILNKPVLNGGLF
jgi:hypothetical protein